jgi:hypothetical protein
MSALHEPAAGNGQEKRDPMTRGASAQNASQAAGYEPYGMGAGLAALFLSLKVDPAREV